MVKRSATSQAIPKPQPADAPPVLSAPLRWGMLAGVVLTVAGGIWYWNSPGNDELSRSLQRAQTALKAGNLLEAYALYQQILPRVPPSAGVPESLAEMAVSLHRFEEVDQWLSKLPHDSEAVSRIQISAASMALEMGHVTRAEAWLQRLLRQNSPDSNAAAAARQVLIHLYVLTNREPELRELIAAMDHTPENLIPGELLLQYCAGAHSSSPDQENLSWLRNALQQDPHNGSVRAAIARLMLRSNQQEGARQLLRQGLELEQGSEAATAADSGSDSWRVRLSLAQVLLEDSQFEAAAGMLSSLPELADSNPYVWIARGRIASERKESVLAREAFAAAVALDPLLPDAAYQQARLAQATGAVERAQENFRRRDLLDQLSRAATRVVGTPREREAGLQEAASLAAQLEMPRLALLLYRTLALNGSEATRLRTTVKQLESQPQSRQLLSQRKLPVLPDRNRYQSGRTGERKSASAIPEAAPADGAESRPEFREVADSTGLRFRYRFADTSNHWLMETLGAGVAVLDFDKDGWPDLFFPQGSALPVPSAGGEPSALFRNVRGQKFADVAEVAGTSVSGFGQGCAVGDFDNDGWPDLLVCFYSSMRLYHNNGDGTFSDVTVSSGISSSQWSTSAAFGDFDRDGDLDLYVVNYVDAPWKSTRACDHGGPAAGVSSNCRPTDYAAAQDSIWENQGDGRFVERTATAGIVTTDGKGLAVIVEDFNNDGWPDIYVANDMTPNHLFQNQGRPSTTGGSPFSFQERGVAAGAALSGQGEPQSSMGLACGDADGDGNFDLFVTNFQEETNTFYRNLSAHGKTGKDALPGDALFSDETAKARLLDLNPPKMGWGCQFLDSNQRGRIDLFVLNGHLLHTPQTPSYYANEGDRFRERRLTSPFFQTERLGRALATLDWNRDLKIDLAATSLKGNVSLLTNDSAASRSVGLQLVGRHTNRDAEGARVIVHVGARRQIYRISRGGGYMAANENSLLIGLGDSQAIDRWEVLWPGEKPQSGGRLEAGTWYRLVEGNDPQVISNL